MSNDWAIDWMLPLGGGALFGVLLVAHFLAPPPLVCEPHQKIQIETRADGSKAVRCVAGDRKVEVLP